MGKRRVSSCAAALVVGGGLLLAGCGRRGPEPGTVVVAIESSPTNLDLRVGTDAQSERVGGLIFDALFWKDDRFELQPWLATRWEHPDGLTWVFHLRDGVRFHDGRPLEAEDVAWSIRSLQGGSLVSAKTGAFAAVAGVDVVDRLTVRVRLKRPDAALLFNLSDGLFGVVPRGAGRDFGLHPVGSGPYRFVSATVDKDVVLERNAGYWAGPPKIERLRFAVVPDAITTALELRRGSADFESNVITLDMVHSLEGVRGLRLERGPSSVVNYLTFNVQDPLLRDRRVRQAMACAMDRGAIVQALWRGQAREADSLLPPGHWARAADAEMAQYPHDVARAKRLLDAAGYRPGPDGVRLRLTIKTSTDETTRMMAAVLQQQMRAAGIELGIRSAEFGTFYADVSRGAFQMYALRWIGSNEDPDIFRYVYASGMVPPVGGNRGHYSNAEVDRLLAEAQASADREVQRRDYVRVQQILAEDLPTIPLWYPNNEVIHRDRLEGVTVPVSGSFAALRTAFVR